MPSQGGKESRAWGKVARLCSPARHALRPLQNALCRDGAVLGAGRVSATEKRARSLPPAGNAFQGAPCPPLNPPGVLKAKSHNSRQLDAHAMGRCSRPPTPPRPELSPCAWGCVPWRRQLEAHLSPEHAQAVLLSFPGPCAVFSLAPDAPAAATRRRGGGEQAVVG